MPRVVSQLKRFFQKASNENFASFKQAHFLNTRSEQDLAALLSFKEQKLFPRFLPELRGLNVLLISSGESQTNVQKIILKNPKNIIDFLLQDHPAVGAQLATLLVSGSATSLPFATGCFDIVIAPLATYSCCKKDLLPELARVLKNRGRAIITLVHPFLDLLLKNQNPASVSQAEDSYSSFFRNCREANLYWEDIGEGEVDSEMKSFFNYSERESCFEQFLGVPLVQCLRAIKFQRS